MIVPATPELVVVIGARSMGQAIARRIGVGKTILLADLNEKAAAAAADTLRGAGFTTSTATVDVASHESVHDLAATASDLGAVTDVVHTAGLSPAQASPEATIAVDLVGVALVLEEFGQVIAAGGSGVVIASQAGHMISPLPADSTRRWPQHPLTSCPPCRSCNPTSSPAPEPRTHWPSEPTLSGSKPPAFSGAIAAPALTRSAQASS